MVSRDSRGRVTGYKRLFDLGMEIEQCGEMMNTGQRNTDRGSRPSWLDAVGGVDWHNDGSGPMEFSTPIARKNTASIFKRFADGITEEYRWKWHNEIPYNHYRGGSGCGSHIHFGTKQSINADVSGTSAKQVTIFYNTAVTILPFCTKWLSWGEGGKLRSSGTRWARISGLQRYTPDTVERKLRMGRGRDGYNNAGFLIWNRRSKSKITLELRINEGMPQWSLPFLDVFLMIVNKHIEIGDSPKLLNHRRWMERIETELTSHGKLEGSCLDETMEFAEGRELRAPVPHIIGEKFPRVMTVREFLHLVDRIAYWVFAYSSRKLYRQQLRFRALGGDPTKLARNNSDTLGKNMEWEPWNYTIEEMFNKTGQRMPTKQWIREKFPKVVKRTHTPFAHVQMGDNRLPTPDSQSDVLSDVIERGNSLSDLIRDFGVGGGTTVEVEMTDAPTEVEVVNEEDEPISISSSNLSISQRESQRDPRYLAVEIEGDSQGLNYIVDGANDFTGCVSHTERMSHNCSICATDHTRLSARGYPCGYCIQSAIAGSTWVSNDAFSERRGDYRSRGTVIYECSHGERVMSVDATGNMQLRGDGCYDCLDAIHRVHMRSRVIHQGRNCTDCIRKFYQYLRVIAQIIEENLTR